METVLVYRLAEAEEAVGVKLVRIGVDGLVVVNGIRRELENGAGWDVEAILKGVRSHGDALTSNCLVRIGWEEYLEGSTH